MGSFAVRAFRILPALVLGIAGFLIAQSPLLAESPRNHILYLMQSGNTEEALRLYSQTYEQLGKHDFDLIQQMGLTLLDQGYRSANAEIQILTLFGAGISMNERSFYILENGLCADSPQMQAIALTFLAKQQNDFTDEALNRALKSDFVPIRLEAAFQLCKKNHPMALDQTESLMAKLPCELLPLFPQLYALLSEKRAIRILRRLLSHENEDVRVAAINAIVKNKRDELLPRIRLLASQPSVAQQEACAAAFGAFCDESSANRLQSLANSNTSSVKLSALYALYCLGHREGISTISHAAKGGDLFAIQLLGKIEGSEPVLAGLLRCDNLQLRCNVAIALLERNDPRCLAALDEILFRDHRDLLLQEHHSHGLSLACYRVTPCGHQRYPDSTIPFELSLSLREDLLLKTLQVSEKEFIKLADRLMECEQNDLVPTLVALLENLGTPEAIRILKVHQQQIGAPLIRNYCNLALFRLKEPGPYGDILKEWVAQQKNVDLIQFRPVLPWEIRGNDPGSFELTAQERSRLLIETFEAFASTQEDKGINLLLDVIHHGNAKNKYALAGLLMRAGQ